MSKSIDNQESIITKESGGSSPPEGKKSKSKTEKVTTTTVHTAVTQRERDVRQIVRSRLEASSKICYLQDRPRGYIRRVMIDAESLFSGLVEVYTLLFISHYSLFSRIKPIVIGATQSSTCTALAQTYISGWFHDLYYTLRKAVETKDVESFASYYSTETGRYSDVYDPFLVILNAYLCPVTLLGTLEETTYVPIVNVNKHARGKISFRINDGFNDDFNEFQTIISVMNERKEFKMEPLKSPNVEGRPIWLLDWWNSEDGTHARVNTPFPLEGNMTLDDVTIAFIVGKAITQHIAPVDIDDWQPMMDGYNPETDDPSLLNRVRARSFSGAVEERTTRTDTRFMAVKEDFEMQPSTSISKKTRASKKGKKRRLELTILNEPDSPTISDNEVSADNYQVKLVNLVQILDYCYFLQVIRRIDLNERFNALKSFVLS